MPLLARFASACRRFLGRADVERDLQEELDSCLEDLIERHVRTGKDPAAARRAALIEMGGMEQVREAVRSVRAGRAIETAWRDLRYAWRGLLKSPGFTVVAVLTLALGIGANTAIFSVVHATLIEPLPFRDGERLVFVWTDRTQAGDPRMPLSGPELADLRERGTLFDGFGAIWSTTAALTGEGDPEQLRVGLVTEDFFSLLGADAAVGRTFGPGDEPTGPPEAILLSWGVWQRRYGGDPAIVGNPILVNGQPATVVGVLPAGFRLLMPPDAAVPDDLQAWLPFNASMTNGPRGQQFLRVIGRMRQGVPFEEAGREVAGIAEAISAENHEYGAAGRRFTAVGLQDDGLREVRPALLALFGAVIVLLLIACVNVASLLVARAAARTRETTLRMALGAGRGRLFGQCFAEGLLLAALAGAAGLLAGQAILNLLLAIRPESLGRIETASINWSVLAFTGGMSVAWAVVCSLTPLTELWRADLQAALRQGRRTDGDVQYRVRAVLVVVQMALGLMLLVGASLMVRTFIQLQQIDPGFRPDGVLTFRLALPGSRYPSIEAANEFGLEFRRRLEALPGVAGVGAISHLPYDNIPNWSTSYLSEAAADASLARRADLRAVTPGLFEAIGARLIAGRFFIEEDDTSGQRVAIVDESLARRAWSGADAVGKLLMVDPQVTGTPTTWVTVVGVIAHMRHLSLTQEVREQVYLPVRQALRNPMVYTVRTTADEGSLAAPVRAALANLDPQLPLFDVRPLEDHVVAARANRRFTIILASGFAAVALVMACVGIYGVMAYSVARRRHEFGVRLALGAQSRNVVALVLREGLRLTAAGVILGVAGSVLASRLIEGQLYGVTAWDPASYALAMLLLPLSAVVACWMPARRAVATSPMDALRSD